MHQSAIIEASNWLGEWNEVGRVELALDMFQTPPRLPLFEFEHEMPIEGGKRR